MKKFILSLVLVAATVLAQAPAPRPQPNLPQYGITELALYNTYTRASYESTFKVQAPAFDASKSAKTWFDSAPCTTGTKTFNTVPVQAAFTAEVTFSVPCGDVGKVNLPGLQHFATFIPNKVRNVKIVTPGIPDVTLGEQLQSTLADATALKAQIGDASLVITEKVGNQVAGTAFTANWQRIDPSNPVGVFYLGEMNVEQTLLQRYAAAGIGSPGKWTTDARHIGYVWVPAPPASDGAGAPVLDVPIRPLAANEKFGVVTLGLVQVTVVNRTDLQPVGPGTGGSFTDSDRKLLQDVHKALYGN